MLETLPSSFITGVELLSLMEAVGDWIFTGFLLFAIIFIVLAAFQFAKDGGDPTQVAAARKNMIFAVIGIIIALSAKGLVTVVIKIIGA